MKSSLIKYLIGTLIIISIKTYSQDDYAKWLKEQQSKYQNFLNEEDKKFAEFLLNNWKPFDLTQDSTKEIKPKIPVAPVFTPSSEIEGTKPENIKSEEIEVPEDIIEKPPIKENIKQSLPEAPTKKENTKLKEPPKREADELLEFDYYNQKNTLPINSWLKTKCSPKLTKEAISKYWTDLASNNCESFINQIKIAKNEKQLNDWGYIQYLYELSKRAHPEDRNSQYMLIWFSLIKTGYEARIGISENKALLLIPTLNKLFGIPFLSDSQRDLKFYVIDFDNLENKSLKEISTYDGKYDGAENYVDMNIRKEPLLTETNKKRFLKFQHQNKEYNIELSYNEGLTKYYEKYPYVNLDVYFNAALSENTLNSFRAALSNSLEGKDEIEAVNLLLSFVQKAFKYKTDEENFGTEKPMFAEEILYYDFSDCEDRSILFANLVKHLLGLKVIGVDYPGHVATAVKFNKEVTGSYIQLGDEKFYICDPTYINATAGVCMPNFKDPEIENIIKIN